MDIKTPLILQPLAIGSVKHQLPINPVSAVAPVTMINSQKFDQQQWLNAILRQLLPQQTSPTLLLAHILKNLPALQHQEHFSADLKMLLQALIQSLPQISSLNNPQLLTHAVQNAGLFLEAHLAQSLLGVATQLPQDFKANLLKLKAALQLQLLPGNIENLPADELTALKVLNENTTGALNKLLVDQLASLPKEDSPKQVWLVEIPFLMPHGTDSLKLEVEHDRGQAAETNQMPCWSVTLTLTPPGLGILYCKVSFVDGVLNTYFRSEDAKTLRMIEQQSEQLRVQFAAVGLKPGHIDMQKGQLGKPLSDKLHHQTLFDDRA